MMKRGQWSFSLVSRLMYSSYWVNRNQLLVQSISHTLQSVDPEHQQHFLHISLQPHIPLFIECDAFCFLNFSHTWTQYYCLISGRYHLPEFCSASQVVLFHLVSSIFSGGNRNPNEIPSLPIYFQICLWHPSNPYWHFTEFLTIPPTDSAGSSNLTTGITFCLLWMRSFAVFWNLPLPTLSHVILVWSILDKDHKSGLE